MNYQRVGSELYAYKRGAQTDGDPWSQHDQLLRRIVVGKREAQASPAAMGIVVTAATMTGPIRDPRIVTPLGLATSRSPLPRPAA